MRNGIGKESGEERMQVIRGREMLAEEVEEVQTGSESEEKPPPVPLNTKRWSSVK